jgi:hypothetical protein
MDSVRLYMLTGIVLATVASAQLNLLANGGFDNEAAKFCPQNWCYVSDTASAAIAPWKASGAKSGRYEVDGAVWPAHSGKWSLDLNSDEAYAISQSIKTVVGKKYAFSMALNENRCGSPVKTGLVRVTGVPSKTFEHKANTAVAHDKDWHNFAFEFVASQPSTEIYIQSTTPGSCGPVLDTISVVEAVPIAVIPPVVAGKSLQKCKARR